MKASELLKCQILQSQIKSLVEINSAIAKQIDINVDRLFEINHFQKSINEQLDKYKLELSIFDELELDKDDCIKLLGITVDVQKTIENSQH